MRKLVYLNTEYTVNDVTDHPYYPVAVKAFVADADSREVRGYVANLQREIVLAKRSLIRAENRGDDARATVARKAIAMHENQLVNVNIWRKNRRSPSMSDVFDYLTEYQYEIKEQLEKGEQLAA